MLCRIFCVALLLCTAIPGFAGEELDRIRNRDGSLSQAYVISETREDVVFKSSPKQTGPGTKRSWGLVASISYFGQDGGYWKAGQDALAAGRHEEAATHFGGLADAATREWQTAYGRFAQGEAWELAGAWAEAAKAYGLLCSSLPNHRLWLDAKYRQGVALAMAGDAAGADTIVKELTTYGDANSSVKVASRVRVSAIQAMVAIQAGDLAKARTLERNVRLSRSDSEAWFHWNRLWAEVMAAKEQWNDAATVYEKMLSQMDNDAPALRTTVLINHGVALARSDKKEQALMQLLAVDTLPYGSRRERSLAQFTAGRLMWELGNAPLPSNPKEQPDAAERNRLNLRTARMLLNTAAVGEGEGASKATEFLGTLSPDPEATASATTAAEAPAAAPAPAPTPAAAPAPAPAPAKSTAAPAATTTARPAAPAR